MAYIKIKLNRRPVDGQPVSFKAPVDCAEISGLKVTYPEGKNTCCDDYVIVDASGYEVIGIGSLFTAGAIVRVLLDTVELRAFIQNADTNNYLEEQFSRKAPGEAFIVNITTVNGALKSDCTADEINQAVLANRGVFLQNDGNLYPCIHSTATAAKFNVFFVSGGQIKYTYYTLRDNNGTTTVTKSEATTAPSGYGLGEESGRNLTNFNEAVAPGFYAASSSGASNGPVEFSNLKYGTLLVENRIKNRVHQTARYDSYSARRTSTNAGSSWGAWEYENPPLGTGTEYRTTERFMGKVVYAKAIDFGAIPETYGDKVVSFGQAIKRLVRVEGYLEWQPSPEESVKLVRFPAPSTTVEVVFGNELTVCDWDYTGCKAYFTVYYTKD